MSSPSLSGDKAERKNRRKNQWRHGVERRREKVKGQKRKARGAQERAMEAEEREPLPLVRVPWSNSVDRPDHYRILTFPKLLSSLSGGYWENQD